MSPFQVDVSSDVTIPAVWEEVVRESAVATLTDQETEAASACTILLTSDERMKALNSTYLGADKPTDVLSFPSGESISGANAYLGDIAISLPTAERQASMTGHSVEAELQLLTVHAVLHLLGYDHGDAEGKVAMWLVQSRILSELGAEITEPKYD